jgi:transcriptional regulator with XRE-family HTH domain
LTCPRVKYKTFHIMYPMSPLRHVRRSRTLTQADMARLLCLSQKTYSLYESGKAIPPVATQVRISAILGVPPAELFQRSEVSA